MERSDLKVFHIHQMNTNFENLTDAQAATVANTMKTAITGDEPAYGLLPADTTALNGDLVDFNKAINDAAIARAASLAKTQDKEAKRTALNQELSELAKKIYATPTVTNMMLAEAGLSPRSTARTKVIPVPPSDMVAKAFSNTSVSLSWKPNGNKYGVTYIVETQAEGGEWTFLTNTTKCKISVDGFEPGVSAWFRVRASKNDLTSLPSDSAAIYHSVVPPSIQLAA